MLIILSYGSKNVLYVGSAYMENLIAGHHVVSLREDFLRVHDIDNIQKDEKINALEKL